MKKAYMARAQLSFVATLREIGVRLCCSGTRLLLAVMALIAFLVCFHYAMNSECMSVIVLTRHYPDDDVCKEKAAISDVPYIVHTYSPAMV